MQEMVDIKTLSDCTARELAEDAIYLLTKPSVAMPERLGALAAIADEIQSRLPEFPPLGRVQFIIADQLLATQSEAEDPVRARFKEAAIGLLEHLGMMAPDTEWGHEARKKLKTTLHHPSPMRQLPPDVAATFIKNMVKKWDI